MTDIDILLHEQDFHRAHSAFFERGYGLRNSLPNMVDRELVQYAHCFDQIKFFNENGTKVDSHFRLLNMGIPSAEENVVWSRSHSVRMGDGSVLIPSPEDILLQLCFHANHHRFANLYYFCDIQELIDHCAGEIDWEYIEQATRERKIRATVYHALVLTDRLLGLSVPPSVYLKFKPNSVKRFVFKFLWLNRKSPLEKRFGIGGLEGPLYYLLEMDGLKSKIAFVLKLFFPPLNWLSRYYGDPKSIILRCRYLKELLTRYRRARRVK